MHTLVQTYVRELRAQGREREAEALSLEVNCLSQKIHGQERLQDERMLEAVLKRFNQGLGH